MNSPNMAAQARSYLSRAHRVDRRIEAKRAQVAVLRDLSTSATAQLSDMPRSDSPSLQRMETLVCKIADLENEIGADILEAEHLRIETALTICAVSDVLQQRVLTLRYLCGRTWNAIIDEMGYSRSHIFRLHEDALCNVEALLLNGGAGH